ncbi:hypothetical protein HDV00_011702 [Rhizophlyctis rosea]|nr:hypothetical protein HDV00_011702 [Rhizophlyctis rosea]
MTKHFKTDYNIDQYDPNATSATDEATDIDLDGCNKHLHEFITKGRTYNRDISILLEHEFGGRVLATSDPKTSIWLVEAADTLKAKYKSLSVEKNDTMFHLAKKAEEVIGKLSELDKLFNSNVTLLHCANGIVLDTTTGVVVVRKAEPTDYSTKSTHLTGTLKDGHLEHYLKKVLCSLLDGRTEDQQFYFFHGLGRNGKSILIKALEKMLGNYFVAPNPAQLASKPNPNPNAPSESTLTLKGKYACAIAEMNETKMAPDAAKSIAGGDGASARHGFGGLEKFRHTSKVIIAANNLPEIEDKTDGTWDKLVVLPFQAKFVDNPKAPHEHLIDFTLEKKLLACADTLLALLVDYYPTYRQQGVRRPQYPKVVRELTQAYRHNIPQQFVDLWVVQKPGVKLLSEDLLTKLAQFRNLYKYANTPLLQVQD